MSKEKLIEKTLPEELREHASPGGLFYQTSLGVLAIKAAEELDRLREALGKIAACTGMAGASSSALVAMARTALRGAEKEGEKGE